MGLKDEKIEVAPLYMTVVIPLILSHLKLRFTIFGHKEAAKTS